METLAQAFTGGWTSGIEMQDASEKSAAQTSILSDQAEATKMKLAEAKEEQINKLADQAAITQATKRNAEAKLDDIKGIHQIYGDAINANRDKPEVVERLRKKMYGLEEDYTNAQITRGKAMEAQRQEDWDIVNGGLTNPEASAGMIRERGKATGNQALEHIADVFENKMPIKTKSGLKLFKDLTPEEEQEFQISAASKIGPKSAQREQNDLARQLQAERDRATRELLAEENARLKAQDIANKQQKTGEDQDTKTIEKLSQADNRYSDDIRRVEDTMRGQGMNPAVPEEIDNPENRIGNLGKFKSDVPAKLVSPRYQELLQQKETLRQNYLAARRAFVSKLSPAAREAYLAENPEPAPIAGTKSATKVTYENPEAIRKAYKEGKLSKEEAKKLLESHGMK